MSLFCLKTLPKLLIIYKSNLPQFLKEEWGTFKYLRK